MNPNYELMCQVKGLMDGRFQYSMSKVQKEMKIGMSLLNQHLVTVILDSLGKTHPMNSAQINQASSNLLSIQNQRMNRFFKDVPEFGDHLYPPASGTP